MSPSARPRVARVRVLELPYSADREYDYEIPETLCDAVHKGSLVSVNFGASQRRIALVVDVVQSSEYDKLKPVLAVADDRFSLDEELLGLCMFLRERTFASTGEALGAILPPGVSKLFGSARHDPVERRYSLAAKPDDDIIRRLSRPARHALELLERGELDEKTLNDNSVSRAVLRGLVDKGIISVRSVEVYRNPYAGRAVERSDDSLNDEQRQASDTLCALADTHEARAALLYGVTGSGKTRVIKSVIDRVLASGRGVILLVPEISLTGQTVDYFCGCYGDRLAVIHSSLSEGERVDAWKRIRAGQADVVIGTRSAIFAPVKRLGLIVIDEEQEHTYKSDMTPKYHARDVARYRAAKSGALMLLSSATPSLESFWRAKMGSYTLVTLRERGSGAPLPEVLIADLRLDTSRGNITPLGGLLRGEIEKNLAANEQTILFVSRRGYNNFVSCRMCGEVITCPHCTVSLTYHRDADNELLKCHYCGYTQTVPDKCPKCGSPHLGRKGFGTQLVAEELHELYPDARIMRMDADSTSTKFSHEQILASFRAHEADILIGTQMVTKGHNFPDVTLVGVISADAALYLDDFRATERTFALLTQVIGRAGRGRRPGRAVLQTYSPENDTILKSAAQDYDGFYDGAIKLRQQLLFPPFCDFLLLGVNGEDEPEVLATILKVDVRLRELIRSEYADLPIYLFGPLEAPVYKVNNVYRMRIIMKCQQSRRLRELISRLLGEFAKCGKAHLTADVNPSSL